MGVYTKVKRESWMKVITTRGLDINKGDEANTYYRSRLVGREIKKDKRDDLFAATPPLESLRMILSICASNQKNYNRANNHVIMSNDIKRAYFYAPVTRPIFVVIPDEDYEIGDEGMVGQLNLSLYGTRDAAMNWAKTYTDFLVLIGFVKGKASPCNFHHPDRGISTTVHGDDFTSSGTEADLKWLDGQLKSKFEVKTNFLGPGLLHAKQLRVLNRVLTWQAEGIDYEADQRHAEIIIEAMQVTKAVTSPGSRDDAKKAGPPSTTATSTTPVPTPARRPEDLQRPENLQALGEVVEEVDDGPPLPRAEATLYRGLAARANYLAQDRPDIQYSVKEIARRMATPTGRDWGLLKRLARYLVGAPRGVTHFGWQTMPKSFDVFVDSDWAGCTATRRSTSGGAARCGWHTVKSWSTTQATVALSSAEAELYSLTKGAAQALGLMAMARDLGQELQAMLHCDASAAIGIVSREGLGKLRHLDVQYLWIQDRVRGGGLGLSKVPGKENPADLLTKHLSAEEIFRHSEALGYSVLSSRADAAPQLQSVTAPSESPDEWVVKGNMVVREHVSPRLTLFTPRRVAGAPPARALTGLRITVGTYVDDNEPFNIVDTWTARSTAHAELPRRWIGRTMFVQKTDQGGRA